MLRVKLLKLMHECLGLGTKAKCNCSNAELADEAAASETYQLRRICCLCACQKKVITVRRRLENRHKTPLSKSGDLAVLCSLLSKFKEPADVPSRFAVHYMKASQ